MDKRGEWGGGVLCTGAVQTPLSVLLREHGALGSASEAEGWHWLCVTSPGPILPSCPGQTGIRGRHSRRSHIGYKGLETLWAQPAWAAGAVQEIENVIYRHLLGEKKFDRGGCSVQQTPSEHDPASGALQTKAKSV